MQELGPLPRPTTSAAAATAGEEDGEAAEELDRRPLLHKPSGGVGGAPRDSQVLSDGGTIHTRELQLHLDEEEGGAEGGALSVRTPQTTGRGYSRGGEQGGGGMRSKRWGVEEGGGD